jgi:hypothetical protein
METLLNLEDYTIAADEVDSTENCAIARLDWQGWAIGDRFQIPRKIKKFSKLFGVWTVTDLWQSGKNAMLTISDGLRTLNQPVKELDLSWKIDDGGSQRESGLLVSESADGEAAPASVSPAVEVSASVAVEVVPVDPPAIVGEACVERIGELSYEEERDRLHLERKVERAFYEAGKALRELRDRRLYRSTHPTFEGYCRDRFGFTHRHVNYLIAGSQVVENLQTGTNGSQTQRDREMGTIGRQIQEYDKTGTNGSQIQSDGEMGTIGAQILPTNERQVRSLVQLEPEQQREAWQQAVVEAGGKVPSGRIVKDIVERMQQVESPPESIVRAHHLTLEPGGLVEVRCPGNEKIHARLGRIAKVREKTVEVWVRDTETMLMVKHSLKHPQVEAVPLEQEPQCKEVVERIETLRGRGLEAIDLEILQLLERAVVLTPREMEHLEGIEEKTSY